MNTLIILTLAVAILVTALCGRKSVRVILAAIIIGVVSVGSFFRGLGQYYERGFIAASVVSLAERTSGEGREEAVAAAEEFRRSFRAETLMDSGSGGELWNAINKQDQLIKKKANKSEMATPRKPSD